MMKRLLAAAIIAVSSSSDAVDLVTTLDGSPVSARTFGGTASIGASFLTNADWSVTGLTVALYNLNSASGTATFSIYDATGTSGTPGALVGTLATFNANTISSTVSDLTFTAPTALSLTGNSRYWLVGSGPTMFRSLYWESETIDTGIGFSNSFTPNPWSAPNYTLFTMGFTLSGTTVVPEPRTLILAGIAAGIIVVWEFWRRRYKSGRIA